MPFQYIGFQRLPPSTLSPSQPLQVAPLIANDLRDEVYLPEDGGDGVELQLAWVMEKPDAAQSREGFVVVKTEQSVQWIGHDSAYRKVDITCPSVKEVKTAVQSAALEDASLRLAMWVEVIEPPPKSHKRAKKSPQETNAGQNVSSCLLIRPREAVRRSQAGETVFLPVLTPPIKITRPGSASSSTSLGKLTHVSRLWAYDSNEDECQGSFAAIEIEEEIGFELDKHIWDASIPLLSLLMTPPDSKSSSSVDSDASIIPHDPSRVIVELGAGTGMLSIGLARSSTPFSRLFASDLGPALELIESNKARNGLKGHGPEVIELDWFAEQLPASLCEALEGDGSRSRPPLVVLASDCSYNPDTYGPFASLLGRLLRSAPKGSMAILSKKHRHADEVGLWRHLEDAGLQKEMIEGVDLDEDAQEGEEGPMGQYGIYAIRKMGIQS